MANPPRARNNKPDPTQPFKAAVGACVRTIAGTPDLEVAFTADRPILTQDKARLASLPRMPTLRDLTIARGQGDAMAMRLASHDADAHRRRAPADPEAKAAFDALEQARVEALGCQRLPGMKLNISEMLEDRLFRGNLADITDKGDAPLAEALAAAKTRSRRYAKRQITWIRGQMPDWPIAENVVEALALARRMAA